MQDITQREFDAARQLLRVLEQEHAALCGNDLPALDAATQSKHECLAHLESLTQHHQSGDNPTLTSNTHPEFIHLIERCRQQNILNGKLIALRRGHTERALHILRGVSEEENCYNPTGRTPGAAATRILGKV